MDIGVENADAIPFGRHGQGQVGGDGGLADASLAGRHGNDILDPFDHDSLLLHFGGPTALRPE